MTEQSFWFIVRNNFVFYLLSLLFDSCVFCWEEMRSILFEDLFAVNINPLVPVVPQKVIQLQLCLGMYDLLVGTRH